MTKEQIKTTAEEMIEWLIDEGSGLEREEVIETAMINFVYKYYDGEYNEEEIIQLCDYLGYEVDIKELNKEKDKRNKRKQRRKK